MSILKTSVALAAIVAVAAQAQVAAAAGMDDLVAAAKKEGELTVIALPRDWCGYGKVIDGFKAKYGLTVNELNPDASSGGEIEAIKANKGTAGPQAPDVIDVGLSFGPTAKDADGFWYGDYYGVLSFVVNADIVKSLSTDWADLQKDEFKNSVSISGDPRSSNQAIQSVFASGLSASGSDIAKAADAGLAFFADLSKKGNFVPVGGNAASLAQGTTPMTILWDYNGLTARDNLKGNPKIEVIVPKSGVVAGVYVQAISAYAPHVNAAKLWMEYIYSDEGQLLWLDGYCHPIRFNDLAANGKIPADMMAKLPPAENYAKAVFPTVEQQAAVKATLAEKWDTVVAVGQ